MVEVLNWDQPVDAGRANIARGLIHDEPSKGTPERLAGPGFGQSLIAGAVLNNSVASILADAYSNFGAGDKPEEFDPSFNPRTWIAQNLPKETQDSLKDSINSGLFDEVPGPNALQRKVATATYEKQLLQQEGGSWLGASLGALAGSVADPLTYFAPEAKWWETGSTAIRLGKSVMHAAAAMAPQEAALWTTQNYRDWEQSLMNVGVGSVLGGGVGFFGRTFLKDNPFNPENPNNPLLEENLGKQGATTIVPGDGADVIPHVSVGEPYSVGAAASPSEAPEILGGRSAVGKFVFGMTPAGRALQWTSDQARSLTSKLIDLGGVYTKTNAAGIATEKSAEDIKLDYLSAWHGEPGLGIETLMRGVQKDLGGLGVRRLDPEDLTNTTQKLLTKTMTPEDQTALVTKYGTEGAAVVKRGAEQYAAAREQVNAKQEAAMKRAGAIRDDAKVEALKGQLDTIREQRNQALKQHDTETTQLKDKAQTAIDAATKAEAEPLRINQMRRDLREQLVQRDADRRGIHEQFDEQPIQSALNHERSLAPALGKDYGHAQLWEPSQISRDHEAVTNFLMDALRVHPDESWLLDAHGLTSKELEKLGTTDPARRLDIMREWTGEEHEYHLRQLKNSLEDAKQREKLAKLDLNDALSDAGVLKSGERQAEVREYGRYRDMLNAEVVAVRGERDRLRLEEQSLVEAATAARQQGLDRLTQPEPGAPVGPQQRWQQRLGVSPTPEATSAFAAQAARAQEVAGQLSKAETRLSDLLDRQLRAERAFEDARDMRVRRKSARQAVQDASRDIAAQQELSAKNTGQVKRAVRAAGKRAPMDEVVADILSHLHKGSIPASALDAVVPEPGRFKARRLNLTPEQKIEAGRRGWLRTDLPNIIRAQDNQIAGHLGLREALDYGPGKTFESWGDVEDRIRSDYRRLADKTPAKRGKLENESDAALKDLNGLKARLLNQVDPGGDKEGWLLWAQKQMRQYNFIRYAQGMLPSSIPDMGAFALQHRVAPMLAAHAKEATHMAFLGDLTPKHNTELRRLLSASEIAIHGSLLSERMNDDQLFRPHGIGAPGSLKNQITSRVDKAGEAMSHYAGRLSGLPQWDRFWKILSGLQMSHDLRDQVGRYAELSDQERTHLAGLGVGEAEAGRLQKFIEAHGETDSESGLWDPKLENWYGSEQGRLAARDFRVAIQRDMNRSRFWPGIGDKPLIADKWYGKMFTQFQNFSFAFTNRYIAQFIQRANHFHDIRAAASFGALMASAAVTMTIKDLSRGITPDKRWDVNKPTDYLALGRELMDRSMILGYTSPYVDAGITMSGLTGATRYEREGVVERLLGVNASLIGDAGRFASQISGVAQGQERSDKVIDKMFALAPFASLLRMGAHTYDAVVNNTPARNPYQP